MKSKGNYTNRFCIYLKRFWFVELQAIKLEILDKIHIFSENSTQD